MYDTSALAPTSTGIGELFQIFRDGRGRTKSELAELTEMSRNTVSARIDALLAAGLLSPAGSEVSSGGRPPARIALNGDAGVILAIDLGATHATVAVTNLAADILEMATTTDVDMAAGPTRVLDSVFRMGNDLLSGA